MLRSMTGYGRAQGIYDGFDVTVEIKSVNHRYFEFYSRVQRTYAFLDEKLKSFLQTKIARGKVECFVQIESENEDDVTVKINYPLAAAYVNALNEISERYDLRNDISVVALSRYADVISIRKNEADEERVWNAVLPAVSQALDSFIAMREKEGKKLYDDVIGRAEKILEYVKVIEDRSPQTVEEYRTRLKASIEELIGEVLIDKQRLLTEVAIYADKIAVEEETVRLRSHIEQLKTFLNSNGEIGRKIDFLIQEMNREANTIGSKSQDVDIARTVVDIKAEIEKIREQIQNIE